MDQLRCNFRRFMTYLVPYLPVTPTFFVRFVILTDTAMNDAESCVVSLISFVIFEVHCFGETKP